MTDQHQYRQKQAEYGRLRKAVLEAGFPKIQLEELELVLGRDEYALKTRFQEWKRVYGNYH